MAVASQQMRIKTPRPSCEVRGVMATRGEDRGRSKHEGDVTCRRSGCESRTSYLIILRKEVIQPQVPLRLPCYDLVPIKSWG